MGCYLCHSNAAKGSFGELACSSRVALSLANLQCHAQKSCHAKALACLDNRTSTTGAEEKDEVDTGVSGVVSGLTDKVPRLDRWVQALTLVKQGAAYEQFAELVRSQAVGSSLAPGGDDSTHIARRLVYSMAEVLSEQDRKILSSAVASSISIDKTGDWMLLYIRVLVKDGIYDCLGGIHGDTVGDVPKVAEALNRILKQMFTVPLGRRLSNACVYEHEDDKFKKAARSVSSIQCFSARSYNLLMVVEV